MSLRDTIIDFAQEHFGDNHGLPDDSSAVRPRLPNWIGDRGIEDAVPIEDADQPITEGPVPDDEPLVDTGTGAGESPSPDVFAFYLPFHFYEKRWGIYVRAYGIGQLARILTKPKPASSESVNFAFRLLLEHERMHFITELSASKAEVAFGRTSYRFYFVDREMAYHEEALANAHAFSSTRRGASKPLINAAHIWMSGQGPGYCDFHKWVSPDLPKGKREAAEFMLKRPRVNPPDGRASLSHGYATSISPGDLGKTGGPSEFLFEGMGQLKTPIYLVVDKAVPWLRFVRPFPKYAGLQVLVHTNDHKPPHIHVKVLQRRLETRYTWRALRPLQGDPRLPNEYEAKLQRYVDRYQGKIEAKVKSVLWT
jgi:hypothetical protein